MRIVVFLLVLANLLLVVWGRGYLGTPADSDARRVEQQLQADQVRVVARGEAPGTSQRKEEGDRTGGRSTSETCQVWSELASDEADQIEKLLGEQFAAFRSSRRTVNESSGYWVYIPPLASKEDATRKTAELQQLGIQDYFIVQASGPNQLAISLGTYRTEEAANAGLEMLRGKGVKSARMGERKGKPPYAVLEIHGPEEQVDALRQAIVALQPKLGPKACKASAGTSR